MIDPKTEAQIAAIRAAIHEVYEASARSEASLERLQELADELDEIMEGDDEA